MSNSTDFFYKKSNKYYLSIFSLFLVTCISPLTYSSNLDEFFNSFDNIKYVLQINNNNLIVIEKNDSVFLPLNTSLSMFSFNKTNKVDKLSFIRLSPYKEIEIDIGSCLKSSDCFYDNQIVYMKSTALSELTGLSINIDLRTLTIETSFNTRSKKQASIKELIVEDQYHALTYPSVALRMSYNNDWSAYSNAYLDILYNQVSFRDNRKLGSDLSTTNYNVKREFNEHYIDYYEFGDVNTSTYALTTNAKLRQGFYLGKQEGVSSNTQDIIGYSDPFSQVELYDESTLLGFVLSDAIGRFVFKDIFIGQEQRIFYVNKIVNEQAEIEGFRFNNSNNDIVSQEWGYSFYSDFDFNYTVASFSYNFDDSHSLEVGAVNDSAAEYFNSWLSLSKEGDNYSSKAIISTDNTGNYAYWIDYVVEMPVSTIVGKWYTLSPDYKTSWTGPYRSNDYFNIDIYSRFTSSQLLRRLKFSYQRYSDDEKYNNLFAIETGFKIGSYFISAAADYQTYFKGTIGLSGYWQDSQASIQADFIENRGMNGAKAQWRKKLSNKLDVNLNYYQSVKDDNYSAGINLNYTSNGVTIGGGYNRTNDNNIFTFQIGVAFSLSEPLNMTGKGSELTLVNLYTKHDDENTRYLDSKLVNSNYYSINTDALSKDYDLIGESTYEQVTVKSHPGAEINVYIPYVTTCSVEGYVEIDKTILSISLEHIDNKGDSKAITLFDDGYYYIEKLEKGVYNVSIINAESEQELIGIMDISNCSNEQPFFNFDYIITSEP